jgi:hypothetical protein
MKSIISFIQEKLQLSKNTKVKKKKEYSVEELEELAKKYNRNDVNSGLKNDIYYKTPQSHWTNDSKMKAYMDKGSKPERLVASIKNQEKLIKRWVAAMDLDWEEAADVFRKEIVDRGYYTEEELFIFIVVYKVKEDYKKYGKYLW